MKKGVRKASDQAIQPPGPDARSEGGRRRMRRSRWRLKQEGQCAARPEAEARAGATGSDLVILSLATAPLSYPLLFLHVAATYPLSPRPSSHQV